MPIDTIEDEVLKNSRSRRRLDASLYTVSDTPVRGVTPGTAGVDATVSAEVYTRQLGGSMIVGHPSAENGVGRGGVGDNRGSWSLEESVTSGATLLTSGAAKVADAAVGEDIKPLTSYSGGGSSAARTATQQATLLTVSAVLSTESVGSMVLTTRSDDGTVVHEVDPGYSSGVSEEVRVDCDVTFEPSDSLENVTATEDGVAMLAESVDQRGGEAVRRMVIGEDPTIPQATDSSLGSPVDDKRASRSSAGTSVSCTADWSEGEPASQPVDIYEVGILSSSGDLVARGVTTGYPKTGDVGVSISMSLQISV